MHQFKMKEGNLPWLKFKCFLEGASIIFQFKLELGPLLQFNPDSGPFDPGKALRLFLYLAPSRSENPQFDLTNR